MAGLPARPWSAMATALKNRSGKEDEPIYNVLDSKGKCVCTVVEATLTMSICSQLKLLNYARLITKAGDKEDDYQPNREASTAALIAQAPEMFAALKTLTELRDLKSTDPFGYADREPEKERVWATAKQIVWLLKETGVAFESQENE